MPVLGPFGPANVVWHSNPGDCRFSFRVDSAAPDPIIPDQVLTIPPSPGASTNLALFATGCMTANAAGDGFARSMFFVDSLGASHGANMSPGRVDPSGNHGFMEFQGWGAVLDEFNNVIPGPDIASGGVLHWNVVDYHLNFITGIATQSGEGIMMACLVDIGPNGVLVNGALTSGAVSVSPTLTSPDPIVGLIIAAAAQVNAAGSGVQLITGSNSTGWSDLVNDSQSNFPPGRAWPDCTLALAVYDDSTVPINLTEQWNNVNAGYDWMAASGILKIAGSIVVPTIRRLFPQVVG